VDLGLFVYGTLRPGGTNHAWLRRTHPEGLALAWTPGRLFALPEGYPALVPTDAPPAPPPGRGWVEGVYVGYETPEELLAALEDLDALEGVEEGLFDRDIRPIGTGSWDLPPLPPPLSRRRSPPKIHRSPIGPRSVRTRSICGLGRVKTT